MAQLKRPGGELATRPLHFIWMVDCSGSMYGEKIGAVNHAIQSTIPEMQDAARNNPNAQLLVRTLKFSTGASWVTANPVDIENFAWDDLDAGGVTDLGTTPPMNKAMFHLQRLPMKEVMLMSKVNDAVIVLAKCGQSHKTYGMRAERVGLNHWRINWAFPIKEASAKREGYDKTTVKGQIEFTDEYPGCPYCGSHQLTVCSCGHIGCTHTNEGVYRCDWCGTTGQIGNYTGEAIVAGMDL